MITKTKDQKWEEEFEKEFINWNFHHKASPCFCDAVSVKNFISKKISKAREGMIKELAKIKGVGPETIKKLITI